VGGRHREVAGLQLRFVDDLRQSAVHRPAARRRGIGVETLGQQGMCEPKPVAVDPDDALALDVFELFDDVLRVGLGCPGHQLDGGRGVTGHCQQHIVRRLVETAYPGPDEFGERHRQRHLRASETSVHRARQLEGVERIAFRNLLYPNDCGPRQRSSKTLGDDGVQAAETQRPDPYALNTVRFRKLQPRCRAAAAVVGVGPNRAEHSDPRGEPARRERDDVSARGVEPLKVVDRHQYGGLLGQEFDRREEARSDRPLIGGQILGFRAKQDAIDREPLRGGQVGQHRIVDAGKQIGQGGVRQYGFRLGRPRREHQESARLGEFHRGQTQGGLADAGLTLGDQAGRLRRRGAEERRNHPALLGSTHDAAGHANSMARHLLVAT
jgi:hypothetical protein